MTSSEISRDTPLVRFWGTRGSIPSPGADTARFGGNTPCLEVRVGGELFILDAGSGLRGLGRSLADDIEAVSATLLLSHFHWDHIQGFPFFEPLYREDTTLLIVSPKQGSLDAKTLFAGQMNPIYFPVPLSRVAASYHFHHLNEGALGVGPVKVSAMQVCHPSFTVGYRLDWEGHSMAYVPDNELLSDVTPMNGWRAKFTDFLSDVDLLVHDAMYTEGEYPSRVGWGHSTYRQALELALEAGAKRLVYFHHDPNRKDDELWDIMHRARAHAGEHGLDIRLDAATEGAEVTF